MKLKNLEERSDYYSEKLGNVIRQMNYTAIAVVWLLSKEGNSIKVTGGLLWVLLFSVASLLMEMFQYFYGYYLNDRYFMYIEGKIKFGEMEEDEEFRWSRLWTWPLHLFFIGKIAFSISAFACLVFRICKDIG